jgi:hypothetical protein
VWDIGRKVDPIGGTDYFYSIPAEVQTHASTHTHPYTHTCAFTFAPAFLLK